MPMPTPNKGETRAKFISRFMSEMKNEYPDHKQRLAIAFDQWRAAGHSASRQKTLRRYS